MRNFVLAICVLLFLCTQGHAQEDLFYKGSQIKYCKVDSEFVAISQKPVTNREYIIYLQWMRWVFVTSYPEFFYKSVPGFNMDSLPSLESQNKGGINRIINCSEPFVRDYMFNPKYLDYPVVGVSFQNANNYGKWLADRYNEHILIKKRFLEYVPTTTEVDYFSTDSYLAGKWGGQVRMKLATNDPLRPERDFEWSDNVFIPVFRLPTKKEAGVVVDNQIQENYFKAYPFSKQHFLYKWNKEYFSSVGDSTMELVPYKYYPWAEKINCNKTIHININGELILDLNNSSNSNDLREIYRQNGQVQLPVENYKEACCEEGLNPYIIIKEDGTHKPMFVSGYKDLQPADYKEFKVFRLACSATPKQLGIKTK